MRNDIFGNKKVKRGLALLCSMALLISCTVAGLVIPASAAGAVPVDYFGPMYSIPEIEDIQSSGGTSLARDLAGNLWGTGGNQNGELGVDASDAHALMGGADKQLEYFTLLQLPAGAKNKKVKSIASGTTTGGGFSLIVLEDGSLWGAGINTNNVNAGKARTNGFEQILVPGVTFTQVSSAKDFVLAIGNGDVYGWGLSASYQCSKGIVGIVTPTLFVDFDNSVVNAIEVKANYQTSYIMASNGNQYLFGYNIHGECANLTVANKIFDINTPSATLADNVKLDIGGYSSHKFDKTNNKLYASGYAIRNSLGNGNNGTGNTNGSWVESTMTGVIFAAGKIINTQFGIYHGVALVENSEGKKEAWGYGDSLHYQWSDTARSDLSTAGKIPLPVEAEGKEVKSVIACLWNTFIVMADNQVYSRGLNQVGAAFGALGCGNGTTNWLKVQTVKFDWNNDGVPDVNYPPMAKNSGEIFTPRNTTLNGSIVDLALDLEGNLLTFIYIPDSLSPANAGTLNLNADGTFKFVPTNNYAGYPTFQYKVNDGVSDSNIATITLSIGANQAPAGESVSFEINENGIVSDKITATDPEDDPIQLIVVNDAINGDFTFDPDNGGRFTYKPHDYCYGVETITYRVYDGDKYSAVNYTITITVNNLNYAPTSSDTNFSPRSNKNFTGRIIGFDPDIIPADELFYVLIKAPDNAKSFVWGTSYDGKYGKTIKVMIDEVEYTAVTIPRFDYLSSENFVGANSFKYAIYDGITFSPEYTGTLEVLPGDVLNRKPEASSSEIQTSKNTQVTKAFEASDPDGSALTYTIVDQPKNGTVIIGATGVNCIYKPKAGFIGTDTFTYKANDGEDDSNIATITIIVNDGPATVVYKSSTITGAQVITPVGALPQDSILDIKVATPTSKQTSLVTSSIATGKIIMTYDINMLLNNQPVQPNGNVTVVLPFPTNFNSKLKTIIVRFNDDGTIDKFDGQVSPAGILFITNHFSKYAIVQADPAATGDLPAGTIALTLLALATSLCGAAFVLVNKTRG